MTIQLLLVARQTCEKCKKIINYFPLLQKKFPDHKLVLKIFFVAEGDKPSEQLAKTFKIQEIPTLMFFHDNIHYGRTFASNEIDIDTFIAACLAQLEKPNAPLTLKAKIINFIKSMYLVTISTFKGNKLLTSKLEALRRYSICSFCGKGKEHKYFGIECTECGCFMKAKTKLAEMHCDLKYW